MDRKRWSSIVKAVGLASGAGVVVGVTMGSRVARAFASGAGVVAASELLVRLARRAFVESVFWAEMRENEMRVRREMSAAAG